MIGASYRAVVSRDGDRGFLHGRPEFARRNAAELDQKVEWAVEDTPAHARQRAARRERTAARRDDLDAALVPLRPIAAKLRHADRETFPAYVIRSLLWPVADATPETGTWSCSTAASCLTNADQTSRGRVTDQPQLEDVGNSKATGAGHAVTPTASGQLPLPRRSVTGDHTPTTTATTTRTDRGAAEPCTT